MVLSVQGPGVWVGFGVRRLRLRVYSPTYVDRIWLWVYYTRSAYTPYSIYLRGIVFFWGIGFRVSKFAAFTSWAKMECGLLACLPVI